MASRRKKNNAGPASRAAAVKPTPAPAEPLHLQPQPPLVLRAFDSIYRFLASLKLAVISISTLAAVLAYATYFESKWGTAAVQEWIYQSPGFAILLAFLGANILCAALIRYPWKKRQTGFVITHAGLLILLAGSYWSVRTSEEGQVAALEGEVKDELIRGDYPVVRVAQLDMSDPKKATDEWALPFRPGAFGWGPGQVRPKGLLGTLASVFSLNRSRGDEEVLTTSKATPFQFVVKSHMPASIPAVKHEAGPGGWPMAQIRAKFKAPGMPQGRDIFDDEESWFAASNKLYKTVKSQGPAQFSFMYVDRPELVEDFLNPPTAPGEEGVARFRYVDKAGKPRVFDWPVDGQAGKTQTLPDSDISVKFLEMVDFPAQESGLGEALGEAHIPMLQFEVSQAGKAPVKHFAMASLPMVPNVIAPAAGHGETAPPPKAIVGITYYVPPSVDPKTNGRFGVVEVLGSADGKLYYRVFGRDETGKPRGKIRDKGQVTKGKSLVAFGGNANMPMTLSFEVDDYLTSGIETAICEPVVLPKAQMGNGLPASLVSMTIPDPDDPSKSLTKEFYIRKGATFEPEWKVVVFNRADGTPAAAYKVAYDAERTPLGFELKMVDFQRGFDPGTEQASRYSSDVTLTDKAAGLSNKAYHIAMNEPLTHNGYTFYQSSFIPDEDPRTGRSNGKFRSVLQVGKNPGRTVMYLGCLLVVLGTFVQFYMRAGLFTDGGKKEKLTAARKQPKGGSANGHPAEPVSAAPATEAADEFIL